MVTVVISLELEKAGAALYAVGAGAVELPAAGKEVGTTTEVGTTAEVETTAALVAEELTTGTAVVDTTTG